MKPSSIPRYKKISYTFLSLEKRPRHLQDCYTAQKMREDLFFPTHYDSYYLNNYQSLYALIRRHSLWENSQNTSVYEPFFLKEIVYEWARRDSGNCSNDMSRNALEKKDLCASFEPYSNLVSGGVTSLRSKMYSLFFYNVVSSQNQDCSCLPFYLKPLTNVLL